ncbi:MAG: hypothetical protein GX809_05805, partial [Clostridiaceae bacterium]|nr:hypothetical protein [Clostridiaceae bacterium]
MKTKLVTIFVILTTIPFSVVGFVSYTRFYSTIEAKTIESTTQLAEQLNQSISSTFQIGERFSKIIQSEAIIRFLTAKDNESLATYESAKDIGKLFKLYRDTFDDYQWIKGIYIIGFNGNNISEAQGVYKLGKDLDSISTVNKILSKPDELLIIPNSHIDYARDQFEEEVISLGTTVVIPTTNQVIGVIIVDIDKRAIEVLSEDLRIGNTGYFTIISEGDDGVVTIFCSDSHENRCELKSENLDRILEESSGHFTAKMNAKREFVVFNTLSEVGWKIVGRVELQDLMKSAYTIRTVTIFVVVLSFVFTAVLYLFISDRLTRPIRELREKMKQAEQGLLVTTDG